MLNLARSGTDEPLAEAFPSLSKARLWPLGLRACPFSLMQRGQEDSVLCMLPPNHQDTTPSTFAHQVKLAATAPLGLITDKRPKLTWSGEWA